MIRDLDKIIGRTKTNLEIDPLFEKLKQYGWRLAIQRGDDGELLGIFASWVLQGKTGTRFEATIHQDTTWRGLKGKFCRPTWWAEESTVRMLRGSSKKIVGAEGSGRKADVAGCIAAVSDFLRRNNTDGEAD